MQSQNQIRRIKNNGDRIAMSNTISKVISDNREITEQIKRDTSRLNTDPSEKLKKLIQKLYMWIWILLGTSALFLIIILLGR